MAHPAVFFRGRPSRFLAWSAFIFFFPWPSPVFKCKGDFPFVLVKVSSIHEHLKVSFRCCLRSPRSLKPEPYFSHPYPALPRSSQLSSSVFLVWKGPQRFPSGHCFTPCPVTSPAPLSQHQARPTLFLCPLLRYLPPATATCPKKQNDSVALLLAAHSAEESFTSLSSDFASALGQEVYLF